MTKKKKKWKKEKNNMQNKWLNVIKKIKDNKTIKYIKKYINKI